jgi:outer membrane protein assembly factor BamE (lipoprotein component of BamABCDE complex)
MGEVSLKRHIVPIALPTAARKTCRSSPHAVIGGAMLAVAACLALAGCSETVTKHGHLFQENDLQQVRPGMSQDQVRTSLGTPTTTAAVGSGSAFYYISSTATSKAFFKPTERERTVLAVYFTPMGSVERVAQYGLKDGKVFDFVKNETPHQARDESMLKALFRNLGTKPLALE